MLYWRFTSKRKSQSITYLLNGSEHIYWILDLENQVHSIRVICTSGLQECKVRLGSDMLGSGQARVGGRGSGFFGVAPARRPATCNARRGYLENPATCRNVSKYFWNFMLYLFTCNLFRVLLCMGKKFPGIYKYMQTKSGQHFQWLCTPRPCCRKLSKENCKLIDWHQWRVSMDRQWKSIM